MPPTDCRLPIAASCHRLLAAARRQVNIIVIGAVIGLILGIGYLTTAVPQYSASALLLLDSKRLQAVQESYGDVMSFGAEGAACCAAR